MKRRPHLKWQIDVAVWAGTNIWRSYHISENVWRLVSGPEICIQHDQNTVGTVGFVFQEAVDSAPIPVDQLRAFRNPVPPIP